MPDLAETRKEIDAIDTQIVALLAKRSSLMIPLAQYKKEHALPVEQFAREKELLARVKMLAEVKGLDGAFVEGIFTDIIAHCKDVQRKAMKK